MSQISLLRPYGYQRQKSCGYCKNSEGSSSYCLQCDNMRVDHYQELVDRGWRRSGKIYYKPDVLRSCCPHWTIRLEASQFKPTREQRRAIHRFDKYVLGSEYKRKAAMLSPVPREIKRQKRDKFDLLDAVHRAEYATVGRPKDKSGQPIEPAHKFEVNIEADSFTKEKYDVFLRYQKEIHKDPVSRWPESAMKRFLCSGLDRSTKKNEKGKTQKLGSYHQCYRLDGKLVAVGVLDLLPHAVSSVYLYYDPDYGHHDWGKISALREIALAIESHYEYYYMGYYIHSCIKMRYKAGFRPSQLLDPETYEWNFFDDTYRQKLDKRKYVSPSRDLKESPPDDSAATKPDHSVPQPAEESNGDTTKSRAAIFADDQELELDEDDPENDDADIPEGSLFDYNVPGILKKDDVANLDLSHWKLVVRNSLVDLEDLRDWEQWQLDDPNSIKGIAAELIASAGPKLLENSAIVLF